MMDYQILEQLPSGFWNLGTILTGLSFYIYGSIPFAFLFVYSLKKQKITERGTGNIGVANAFGTGGLPAGFLTVGAEATKVVIPVLIADYFFEGSLTVKLFFLFLVILGTHFSPFLKFKGGQGSTVLLWSLLILSPLTFLLFGGVFLVIYFASKNRPLMWMIGHLCLPAEIFIIERSVAFTIFGLVIAVLFILKYKPGRSDYSYYRNEMRLFRFLESKFAGKKRYIVNIGEKRDAALIGSDAKQLWFLFKEGFRIPRTHVCTADAYLDYINGSDKVMQELRKEIEGIFLDGRKHSVRLSSDVADKEDYSVTGQPVNYFNIYTLQGAESAIKYIWNSAGNESKQDSRNSKGYSPDIKIAVIIQEMVDVKCSGVVFTRNPLNGLDEIVIEAMPGTGNSIIQDRIMPQRWVWKWGKWIEKPDEDGIDAGIITKVVEQARKIEKKYGKPADIEWSCDGEDIYWLQLKTIEGLKGINVYSNKISKEFMPGMIKPLVWSINIPVVNTSWKTIFTELIGKTAEGIDIHRLAKSFYYRSYFNMGIIGDIFSCLGLPRESIELLLGFEVTGGEKPKIKPTLKTLRYIPRVLLFIGKKSVFSRKISRFLREQWSNFEYYSNSDIEKFNAAETIHLVERLLKESVHASYYVIITQLLMGLYVMIFNRYLKRLGIDEKNIGISGVRKTVHDIDPIYQLDILHRQYNNPPEWVNIDDFELTYAGLSQNPGLEDFKRSLDSFLEKFGHFCESGNDFSKTSWKESPDAVLKMIQNHQPAEESGKEPDVRNLTANPVKKWLLQFLYNRAVQFQVYRERVNFVYYYGYSVFRPCFLHIAELFQKEGYISSSEDIFCLTFDEIREIVRLGSMPGSTRDELNRRKRELEEYKDIKLPDLIIGDSVPLPVADNNIRGMLRGVAASGGYAEGKIRIIHSLDDSNKAKAGDIIVIPYSDAAWTPLLLKAGAIISEAGGILSHCAIVAREHNIPAIVSVARAMQIPDGTEVSVDSYKGEVVIKK